MMTLACHCLLYSVNHNWFCFDSLQSSGPRGFKCHKKLLLFIKAFAEASCPMSVDYLLQELQLFVCAPGDSEPRRWATDGRRVASVQVIVRAATRARQVGGVLLATERHHHLPGAAEVWDASSSRRVEVCHMTHILSRVYQKYETLHPADEWRYVTWLTFCHVFSRSMRRFIQPTSGGMSHDSHSVTCLSEVWDASSSGWVEVCHILSRV